MANNKLTPQTQARIFQAIRAGNYKNTACAWAGISETTLQNWMKKGRAATDDKDPYARFLAGLNEAIATAEVHNVAIVQKAAEKNWQASAWMLERRHPERWSRNDKQRIEMKAEIDVDGASSKDKLKSLLDGIADRLKETADNRGDDSGTG